MDESNSYVKARMLLLKHAAKYGGHGLYEPDSSRAGDETTALVDSWLTTKAREAKLRPETLGCITFTAKGKIEVHDPARLEDLNAEISSLMAQHAVLDAAIEKLSAEAPDFLCDLLKARDAAEELIARAPREINSQLGTELKYYNFPSVEAAMKSPRYLREKQKWEAAVTRAKASLEALEPKIALIKDQLKVCGITECVQPA